MPQTLEQTILTAIEGSGLFKDQAQEILNAYKASPEAQPMLGRWNDNVNDYPDSMLTVVMLGINRHAIEWFDKNCPNHWARALFNPPSGTTPSPAPAL